MSLEFLLVELRIWVIFRWTFGHLSKSRRTWLLLFESYTDAVFVGPAISGSTGNVEILFYPSAKACSRLALRLQFLAQVIQHWCHQLPRPLGRLDQFAFEVGDSEVFNFGHTPDSRRHRVGTLRYGGTQEGWRQRAVKVVGRASLPARGC